MTPMTGAVLERPSSTLTDEEVIPRPEIFVSGPEQSERLALAKRFWPIIGPPSLSYLDTFKRLFVVETAIPPDIRDRIMMSDDTWGIVRDGDMVVCDDVRLNLSRKFDSWLCPVDVVHAPRQTFGGGRPRFFDDMIRVYTLFEKEANVDPRAHSLCFAYRRKLCIGIGHFVRPLARS